MLYRHPGLMTCWDADEGGGTDPGSSRELYSTRVLGTGSSGLAWVELTFEDVLALLPENLWLKHLGVWFLVFKTEFLYIALAILEFTV